MNLLSRHSFPPEAWLSMTSESESPDVKVKIERIVQLVDRCPLVLTFTVEQAPDFVFYAGLDTESTYGFYAGQPPTIERVTICRSGEGSTVAVELRVYADSAIYVEESATLYVCAPALS